MRYTHLFVNDTFWIECTVDTMHCNIDVWNGMHQTNQDTWLMIEHILHFIRIHFLSNDYNITIIIREQFFSPRITIHYFCVFFYNWFKWCFVFCVFAIFQNHCTISLAHFDDTHSFALTQVMQFIISPIY